ncbi:phage tail assembly protein [Endozoicomonas ascidiicola]|uniref:phage tail assembly protein n=1 Tax=Endozoicomonas ascidiicola TaxID=1698521 RepID=UPI00082FD7B7|nr:phage tail assembly protein [Endozoicomonas ascidiicola]
MLDTTETIRFTREYNLEAGRLHEVDMREPTTADIRKALMASQKYQADMELRDIVKEQTLLVELTGLTPTDIDRLAACDYERLQIGLLILRADPNNRAKLRAEYVMGETAPSDSDPATSEGDTTESKPDAVTPISALP